MSVQDLLATHDCSVVGCSGEAYEHGGLCRYHQTTTDRPRPVHPGSHAHLMEESSPVNTCKIPGCTNPSAGKGGPWADTCQQHISAEIARRQAVRHAKPKTVKPPPEDGQPKRTPAAPVAAKAPAPAVPERTTNGHTPLSLTELAQAVDQANEQLEQAQHARAEALAQLRAAVEAS